MTPDERDEARRRTARAFADEVVGYTNPDGSGEGDWSELEIPPWRDLSEWIPTAAERRLFYAIAWAVVFLLVVAIVGCAAFVLGVLT